ncbi:MAG: luciferase family protein [Bacteroidota bacterium]
MLASVNATPQSTDQPTTPLSPLALRVAAAVAEWSRADTVPHRYGGVEFRVGTREFGHIHPEGPVDIPFTKRIRDEVVAAGLASRHHVLPKSGWVSVQLTDETSVENAVSLLRRSYLVAMQRSMRQTANRS